MPLDYSKWDKLEGSDSDEDRKPRVIKLDRSECVELTKDGYNILSNTEARKQPIDHLELCKFWKRHIKNGMVQARSHVFSQDRYDLNILIAVNVPGKPRFEVSVEESSLTISSDGTCIVRKYFFSKVKIEDDAVNWQVVRKLVDWDALQKYCLEGRQDSDEGTIKFTELYEQAFIELDLKKQQDIADCFLWWPKAFKDDQESRTFKTKGSSTFMDSWNKAHEQFKERVKNFEKVQL